MYTEIDLLEGVLNEFVERAGNGIGEFESVGLIISMPAYYELKGRRIKKGGPGKCRRCGADTAATECAGCAQKKRDTMKAGRSQRKAAGLCVDCGLPSNGTTRCDVDAAKRSRTNKAKAS